MKSVTRLCLAFVILWGSTLTASAQTGPTEIYVFGDSLSDNGNLSNLIGVFPWPSFEGKRISNGPVAVEQLAAKLGLVPLEPSRYLEGMDSGNNYAVAGATAGGEEPQDLAGQVGAFLLNKGFAAPPDALYIVFIGSNDLFAAQDELRFRNALAIIDTAVDAIEAQIRRLIDAGAESIMVINAPDIAKTPSTTLVAEALNQPLLPLITSIKSFEFNRQLAKAIRRIERDTGLNLIEYDLAALFDDVLQDASALGYTNSDEACFFSSTQTPNPACESGGDLLFDEFFFFDEVHPTAVTHERLARAFFAFTPLWP